MGSLFFSWTSSLPLVLRRGGISEERGNDGEVIMITSQPRISSAALLKRRAFHSVLPNTLFSLW